VDRTCDRCGAEELERDSWHHWPTSHPMGTLCGPCYDRWKREQTFEVA
jgi:hypothetical protein